MRDEDIALRVAQRLRQLRVARAMSLRELARNAGVTPEMASRAERGVRIPAVQTLAKLCHGLGIELSGFFDFDRTQSKRVDDVALRRLTSALGAMPAGARRRAIGVFEEILAAVDRWS